MLVSTFSLHGRIALLTIDNPPVNALSHAVRAALVATVTAVEVNEAADALVIACAGRTFIAGADIREFGKPSVEPFLTAVIDAIEACKKPVIAAIHGSALGGGLEVAMASHYRIAQASAKLGLPEVKLGLMPGARGTQHLPRLVGVAKALEMIAFGAPISAGESLEIGLVDRIAHRDLLSEAIEFAAEVADKAILRTRDRAVDDVPSGVFGDFAKTHARKFKGLDAPEAIIRSVQNAVKLPFDEGARKEREIFLELRAGPQNAALRHVFFAERQAAKVPGLEETKPREIDRVGIVGAGTMGSGIAIAFLTGEFHVVLVEQDAAALARGRETVRQTLDRNVNSGRMTQDAADAALDRLTTSLDFSALSDVDLVVEAAFETMEVKRSIFARLDGICRNGAILATNTSYLDIDEIADVTSRPSDVVGLHFFSPANIMKLLEIVRGKRTSPVVIATALSLSRRLAKIPVVAGNAYGFIGNRMLAARRRQADQMILEGASPYAIDAVAEAFGFPMGPFRISDLAGLDLGWSAVSSTGATVRERLCEAGRRGQKSGAGFYDYTAGGHAEKSRVALDIIEQFATDHGHVPRDFSDDEILDRLIWPMIDEGVRILDEGIAIRASDIDMVWLNGYGWPAWTGGPMYHADQVGAVKIVTTLQRIGVEPSTLLSKLAVGGGTLATATLVNRLKP